MIRIVILVYVPDAYIIQNMGFISVLIVVIVMKEIIIAKNVQCLRRMVTKNDR